MTDLAPTFHEVWFHPGACTALARLVATITDTEGRIVEIGSWEGVSTIAMAITAHPRIVHAVDTWDGSPGEISEQLATERDVYAQFLANIDAWSPGNIEPHRMDWREYRATSDDPVALLFVDAAHTYLEVVDTIEAFRPLMTPGGVICGDDWHHPPVQNAVRDTLGDFAWDASVWSVRT